MIDRSQPAPVLLNGGRIVTVQTGEPPLPIPPPEPVPPLRHGDRLSRDEFERRYRAMPEINKAELLDGVVYMPSPVSDNHGGPHFDLIAWLGLYRFATPGVAGSDNGTIRLDLASEPQPDAFLRILATHGGQSRIDDDGYVEGAPELAAEVAVSSIPVDLEVKLPLYRRNGVREYVVWRVPDRAIDWFVLRGEEYERLPAGEGGVYRSEVFPGLWLDAAGLVGGDLSAVSRTALLGLASPEHAAFVRLLEERARGVGG
jgi:Uma2 family endonuclease